MALPQKPEICRHNYLHVQLYQRKPSSNISDSWMLSPILKKLFTLELSESFLVGGWEEETDPESESESGQNLPLLSWSNLLPRDSAMIDNFNTF